MHHNDVRVNAYCSAINMSKDPCAIHIGYIQNVTQSWPQCMLTVTIGLSSIPSIRVVMFDALLWTIRIESPYLNYYSLGLCFIL